MRADAAMTAGGAKATWAGARTWLLAVMAGWALCIWALGLFGLGSRIRMLPDDPALLQRLPGASKPGPERLGSLGQYSEIGARPLFSDDRRPQPFFINPEGEGEKQNPFDYILTSVLLTPRLAMAIVQPGQGGEPIRLKVGEAPEATPSWTLASVNPRSVVFNGPEGERTLELRVFDGVGGQPPTPITLPVLSTQPPQLQRSQNMRPPPVLAAPPPPQMPQQMPQQVPQAPQPAQQAPPPAPGNIDGSVVTSTPEAQAEAIRQRIEARRAQLLQQSQSKSSAPTNTP